MFTEAVKAAKPDVSNFVINKVLKKERPFLLPGDGSNIAMQKHMLTSMAVESKFTKGSFEVHW